jgi:hypothetical protein
MYANQNSLITKNGLDIMKLIGYISGLLSFFKDRRIIENIEQMIQKIIENKTIQLFKIADDKKEYNRYKSLLEGSLKSVLDKDTISQALRENSADAMFGQKQIVLIHDPCDIRKKYAKQLENIGKVLDLDKNTINGYSTFNTVAVDEENKRLHLVDTKVYSNRDPHFITQKELEQYHQGILQKSANIEVQKRAEIIKSLLKSDNYVNLLRITQEQLKKTSQSFKREQPKTQIIHVLDCGFDDKKIFIYINNELEDEFAIRLKLSRNSNETYVDEKDKKRFLKLKNIKMVHNQSFEIKKLELKGKIYKNASCFIEYDNFIIEEQTYTVIRATLKDRKGKKIFEEPMLLLTNRKIKTAGEAHGIYLVYLQRSKIEGVFKFLKDVLGWEEFQVRDFESIKNIIALCFFIGGYFYEIESDLIENVTIQYICDLGGGKGKYTRYYFLQGLAKILTYNAVEQFIKNKNINDEEFRNMKNVLRY